MYLLQYQWGIFLAQCVIILNDHYFKMDEILNNEEHY